MRGWPREYSETLRKYDGRGANGSHGITPMEVDKIGGVAGVYGSPGGGKFGKYDPKGKGKKSDGKKDDVKKGKIKAEGKNGKDMGAEIGK